MLAKQILNIRLRFFWSLDYLHSSAGTKRLLIKVQLTMYYTSTKISIVFA